MKKQTLRLFAGILLACSLSASVSAGEIFTELEPTESTVISSEFPQEELPLFEEVLSEEEVGGSAFEEPVLEEDIFTDSEPVSYSNVIQTGSLDDYNAVLLTLIEQHPVDDSPDSAASASDSDFATARLLVTTDGRAFDFSPYGPETVLLGIDNDCILQFSTPEEAENACLALQNAEGILIAEPDVILELEPVTWDEAEDYATVSSALSWGTSWINADKYAEAVAANTSGSTVKVAVIDSGMDTDHPYIKSYLKGSYNYSSESGVEDRNGHGTHVAGIIVSCTQGLSSRIGLYNIRICDSNGSSNSSLMINGIKKAQALGVKVANLSVNMNGSSHVSTLHSAINSLIGSGCVFVNSAGNFNKNASNSCPADLTTGGMIVVGNLTSAGDRNSTSNYGSTVDCYAPGTNIESSFLNGGYAYASGTSMAAPHVTALVAMMKLAYPSYSPSSLESLLKKFCQKTTYGLLCPHPQNFGVVCNSSAYYGYQLNGNRVTGWYTWNGSKYYFGTDYKAYTGKKTISGATYYFNSSGQMKTSWRQIGSYWYYFGTDGKMLTGFRYIGTAYYYFDSSGRMAVGWKTIDGNTYYFRDNGTQKRGGWKQIDGYWYYFNPSGVRQSGLLKIGSVYYYFDSSGKMVSNKSLVVNGQYWKFDSSGHGTRPTPSYGAGVYSVSFGSAYNQFDFNKDGYADLLSTKMVSSKNANNYTVYQAQIYMNDKLVYTGVTAPVSYRVTMRFVVLADGKTFLYYQPDQSSEYDPSGCVLTGSGTSFVYQSQSNVIGGAKTKQSSNAVFKTISLTSDKKGFVVTVYAMNYTLGYGLTYPVTYTWNGSSLSRTTTSQLTSYMRKDPSQTVLTANKTLYYYTSAGGSTKAFTLTSGGLTLLNYVYVDASGNLYFYGINASGQKGWLKGQVGSGSPHYFKEAVYAG